MNQNNTEYSCLCKLCEHFGNSGLKYEISHEEVRIYSTDGINMLDFTFTEQGRFVKATGKIKSDFLRMIKQRGY
jgi:hypothetical protein